jgi:uncharacterized membrane protein SirB2
MIPYEYLVPYLGSNAFALAVLALAFWRRDAARWAVAAVFAAAAVINARTATTHPAVYVEYAPLTVSTTYRDFILGWFSHHVQALVLPIALGQLMTATLLASRNRTFRRLGLAGACLFLLAIAPLGVGSAFPFSLTFGSALLVSSGVAGHLSPRVKRALWWSPRLLGLLLSVFLGVFALDAFSEGTGALEAMRAFAIHLLPAGIVLGLVALAWRAERVGGVLFFALAVAYGAMARGRVSWMLVISAPLIVEGALFLWSSLDTVGRAQKVRQVT